MGQAVKLGLSQSNSIFTAGTHTLKVMYSSEDLERFNFKYQTEALPHGQSLQSFCLSNKTCCKRPSKSPLKGDFPVQPFSFKGIRGALS